MKLILCVLFTLFGSLQSLTLQKPRIFKQMILFSLIAAISTASGYALGQLILLNCKSYTSFELTSIILIFLFLYLIQVKSKHTFQFQMIRLVFSYAFTGLLSGLQSFPVTWCLCLSMIAELMILKHHSFCAKHFSHRKISVFLIVMMLMTLFSIN